MSSTHPAPNPIARPATRERVDVVVPVLLMTLVLAFAALISGDGTVPLFAALAALGAAISLVVVCLCAWRRQGRSPWAVVGLVVGGLVLAAGAAGIAALTLLFIALSSGSFG